MSAVSLNITSPRHLSFLELDPGYRCSDVSHKVPTEEQCQKFALYHRPDLTFSTQQNSSRTSGISEGGCIVASEFVYYTESDVEHDCPPDVLGCVCLKNQFEVDATRFVDANGVRYGGRLTISGPDQYDSTVTKDFSVCDDGWDINDVKVVCRQLGLQCVTSECRALDGSETNHYFSWNWNVSNANSIRDAQMFLSNVDCVGDESNILECPTSALKNQYSRSCPHSSDAGVICDEPLPQPLSPPSLEEELQVVPSVSSCFQPFEPCMAPETAGVGCPLHFGCFDTTSDGVESRHQCNQSNVDIYCTCEPFNTTEHDAYFGRECSDPCFTDSAGHFPLDGVTDEGASIENSATDCRIRCSNTEYSISWQIEPTSEMTGTLNQTVFITSIGHPDQIEGRYEYCSAQNELCICDGTVKFGASTQYLQLPVQGSIECTVDVFGDPLKGVDKHCYCLPKQYPAALYWEVLGSRVMATLSSPRTTFVLSDGLYRIGDMTSTVEATESWAVFGISSMVSLRLADGKFLLSHDGFVSAALHNNTAEFRAAASFYLVRSGFAPGGIAFMPISEQENYIIHRQNARGEFELKIGTVCTIWSWYRNSGSCHLSGGGTRTIL